MVAHSLRPASGNRQALDFDAHGPQAAPELLALLRHLAEFKVRGPLYEEGPLLSFRGFSTSLRSKRDGD